jgi:hypothetical protein
MLYGSFRFRGRVTGSTGACAGFFVYGDTTDEADIEFLTQGSTSEVHYTNQPVSTEGATEVVQMPGAFSDWHTHRMDWIDGKTSWFEDGGHLQDITIQVPKVASKFVFVSHSYVLDIEVSATNVRDRTCGPTAAAGPGSCPLAMKRSSRSNGLKLCTTPLPVGQHLDNAAMLMRKVLSTVAFLASLSTKLGLQTTL